MVSGSKLIDDMHRMMMKLKASEPVYREGVVSAALRQSMSQGATPRHDPTTNPIFGGIQVRESSMFPHQFQCQQCCGTGEGDESTYCKRCAGAGEIRIEGTMSNGSWDNPSMVMLTAKLPKKFQPRWPADVQVPLRASAGIRSVAWP